MNIIQSLSQLNFDNKFPLYHLDQFDIRIPALQCGKQAGADFVLQQRGPIPSVHNEDKRHTKTQAVRAQGRVNFQAAANDNV
jgi:hypothetical protein